MSRVGKLAVQIQSGVNVTVSGQTVQAKGAKKTLSATFPGEVSIKLEGDKLWFKPVNETKRARAMWGMARNTAKNMIIGVTEGFSKDLEINGVGYRAAVQGKVLKLNLGFSHDVNYPIPEGIEIKVTKNVISIAGADVQQVGQVAAEIRKYRMPEPYKGKGIKYTTETIRRKEGKKK